MDVQIYRYWNYPRVPDLKEWGVLVLHSQMTKMLFIIILLVWDYAIVDGTAGASTAFCEEYSDGINNWSHNHFAGYYQFPGAQINGIALDYNGLNLKHFFPDYDSYQSVLSAAWGCNLGKHGLEKHSIGVTLKYVYIVNHYPNTHNEPNDSIGDNTFADGSGYDVVMDAGYLWQFFPGARAGLLLQNIGPPMYFSSVNSGLTLPLTLNIALAYTGELNRNNGSSILKYSGEVRVDKDLVNRGTNMDWCTGLEATLYNTVSLRTGFHFGTQDLHVGLGFLLLNHFQFDSFATYHGQMGVSMTMFRMFSWNTQNADLIKLP